MNTIAALIQKIAHSGEQAQVLVCTVDTVNGNTCDVTPIDKSLAPLKKVRLTAFEEKSGIIITPKKDSFVIIHMLSHVDAYVALFSEIEKVSLKNEQYSLRQAFDDLLDAITKLTVTTGTGPSGQPINMADFQQIQQNISKFLE